MQQTKQVILELQILLRTLPEGPEKERALCLCEKISSDLQNLSFVVNSQLPQGANNLLDNPENLAVFEILFNSFMEAVHNNAKSKGWWETPDEVKGMEALIEATFGHNSVHMSLFRKKMIERNAAEAKMLMVCEIAESVENDRAGNPNDDHLMDEPGDVVEMADTIIRILDWVKGANREGLFRCMIKKHIYNTKRPIKHGNKKF